MNRCGKMQQGNKVCSREDERRAFVVYLFYGAHRFREDFEAIVQSLETALGKAKVAEKTPIVVKEFAGADVPFDERGEEWIRRAAFSHSSRVWSVRLRVVHKFMKSSVNSERRDFVTGKKPLSEFLPGGGDEGFGLAFYEFLRSRNIRFVLENLGFEAWILGEMQKLLDRDITRLFTTWDDLSYFNLSTTRINLTVRKDQRRDHDLALQIRRMAKKRSISPMVVRGSMHSTTLERSLKKLGVEFEVLVPSMGSFPPREDVIGKRQIDGKVDTELSDDERLQLLRHPLYYEFEYILRNSTRSGSHLSSDQVTQHVGPIIDRWTRQDLDVYFRSSLVRQYCIYLWIEKNCTEAEKRRFHHYRTLGQIG